MSSNCSVVASDNREAADRLHVEAAIITTDRIPWNCGALMQRVRLRRYS